jgi:hypothetical protein
MSDENSVSKILILSAVRLVAIGGAIGFAYVIARLIQMLVGQDIIQEEEIVIVHEHATEEEAAKARNESRRQKKSR